MLEEYLKNLTENRNYDLSNMKINSIKEDDKNYVVYFEEKVDSIGRQSIYKIDKKTGKNDVIFLPDEDNFQFLDYFENCNFVNIPEKFRDVYF